MIIYCYIFFYINSPGGVVTSGLSIYDTMQYIKCDVSTICIGFYLGAVFMRGGNILVPMLIHALHDMLILSFQDADEVSAIVKRDAAWEDIIVVLLCFALAAFGYFLIRKSKRAEICAQWAETWSQTTESLPETPAESENTTGGTI